MLLPIMRGHRDCLLLLICGALFTGCDDTPSDAPYVEFTGGGFIFNYRMATGGRLDQTKQWWRAIIIITWSNRWGDRSDLAPKH